MLTAKQTRALNALISGETIQNAAQLAGVTERQVYRWLAGDIGAQLRVAQTRALDDVTRRLVNLCCKAIDTLDIVMDGPERNASAARYNVRRLAARDVLELCHRFVELRDFDARLAALESKVNER